MKQYLIPIGAGVLFLSALLTPAVLAASKSPPFLSHLASPSASDPQIDGHAQMMFDEGRRVFRFDTFGDQTFWGDSLKLHQAIAGSKLGGVGPGVSPQAALSVGLKVDMDALPQALAEQVKTGQVNLDDPATTVALLKLNAVVGVTGFFNDQGNLRSMGIQCAVCHSTVDDAFAPGIGHRLDGWANRDLNVGAIIAMAPDLSAFTNLLGVDANTVKTVLMAWGPGKFDAALALDGKGFRPDGKSAATLIPPAFGLAGVNLQTWTGWGSVAHWNAFVANLEMHGQGTFYDPRLNDAARFPVAARAGMGNVRNSPDLVSSSLAPLHFYQLGIPAPAPPAGSFDQAGADRGELLFTGKARCATCHVLPLFTEPGWNMHTPAEIGIDDFQANRSPDQRYRTAPLKGLWTHTKGGFYHDGRYATLADVVQHYNGFMKLELSSQEVTDVVEYLKSLGSIGLTGKQVRTVYQQTLCRDADPTSLNASMNKAEIASDSQLRALLAQSDEGRRVELVRLLYDELLGRNPIPSDCRGLRSWVDGTLSVQDIRVWMMASPEFRSRPR